MQNKINIVFGTTASGKTDYAIKLATKLGGEVINCDSMQVYSDIPILTAQPTQEEMGIIPHHLFGYIQPSIHCNVGMWLKDVTPKIQDLLSKGCTPILVGGTGMYIKALVEGLDEMPVISDSVRLQLQELSKLDDDALFKKLAELDQKSAKTLSLNDTQRILRALAVVLETGKSIIDFRKGRVSNKSFEREQFYINWLSRDRAETYDRINKRFDKMIENAVLQEVENLMQKYGDIEFPKAHGLPELISYLKNEVTLEKAVERAKQITRNYAKRQVTWAKHQIQFDQIIEV